MAGEEVCLRVADDMDVVILRPPAVYGPRDRDFFLFFLWAMRGVLAIPAGGERMLQLIHVHDLVDALIRAATLANAAGIYHIAEARSYAWADVVTWIAKAVGKRVRTVRVPHWLVRTAAAVSEFGAATVGKDTIFNRDKARELLAPGWLCENSSRPEGTCVLKPVSRCRRDCRAQRRGTDNTAGCRSNYEHWEGEGPCQEATPHWEYAGC